jgi:hypothetical protein
VDLARQYRLAFVPFLLEGVGGVPRLNQADGIHLAALLFLALNGSAIGAGSTALSCGRRSAAEKSSSTRRSGPGSFVA